jgi:hypothetical protein
MRRSLFGLALIPLTVCSSVAGEAPAPSSVSGGSQEVQTSLPSRGAKNSEHISIRNQPDRDSAPAALPLSAAATYASEHSASMPISSAPKPPPPSTHSWTGFYVGAGVGATQP